MKEIKAFQSDCGRIYKHKSSAISHDKKCKCWSNPKLKTCKSCVFGELHDFGGGMATDDPYPIYFPSSYQWKCNHESPVYFDLSNPEFCLIGKEEYMMNSNCQKWQGKN